VRASAIWLALAAALGGCAAHSSGGTWSAAGYENKTFAWRFTYPPGKPELLGAEWRLDNWEQTREGAWKQKRGVGYTAIIDENGDGRLDDDERANPVFLDDLKFANVRNNASIWLKARRLHSDEESKDLDVLLENYVAELTSGFFSTWREHRAVLSTRSDITLAGQPAVSALVELRPRRKEEPDERTTARFAKLHLVMAKFDYLGPAPMVRRSVSHGRGVDPAPLVPGPRPRHKAVLVIGYINDNERFDSSLPDVAKLLGRIELPRLAPAGGPPAPAEPKSPPTAPVLPPPDPANPALEI
jgi:hypothetical protein